MDSGYSIDRPVFIVGPHRSGTTLLYGVMARHEHVACMVRYNQRFPAHPGIASALRTLLRGSMKPHETQRFWDYLWQGPDDTMGADDLRPEHSKFYPRIIAGVLRQRGRTRFIAKYPRLSLRTGWLDALFPGALFLHMARDWRAVVNSTVQGRIKREKHSDRWYGMRIPGWQDMGGLAHEVAAARQFRVTTLAIEEQARRTPERFHRIGYAGLCRDIEGVMRGVAEFAGLRFSDSFRSVLPRDLKSRNDKWKTNLSQETLAAIRAEDPGFFERYEEDSGQ